MTQSAMLDALRALSSDRRLMILAWLKDPLAHFSAQDDGDLVEDGVCGQAIADKLGISQPTASAHLKILLQAGLVRSRRVRQWTFYRRDEDRLAEIKDAIRETV